MQLLLRLQARFEVKGLDNTKDMNLEDILGNAKLAFMQGKYPESLRYAKNAIKLDDKCAEAYQFAANAYMSYGDYDLAIKNYIKAVENDSSSVPGKNSGSLRWNRSMM